MSGMEVDDHVRIQEGGGVYAVTKHFAKCRGVVLKVYTHTAFVRVEMSDGNHVSTTFDHGELKVIDVVERLAGIGEKS